ncbi:MAG: DNA polymerase III subunit chi [Alphaproteobacteria bacterium]|nr:DNA polymerase III subunit chi [Alphaproteobacteria bacterium]
MSEAKAEVSFYQLTTQPVEKVLPKILEKVYGGGMRALVVAHSTEHMNVLNSTLWTYSPGAFLPHGMSGRTSDEPLDHPIWLTLQPVNENRANVVVLTNEQYIDNLSDYSRCVDIFDGNNSSALEAAHVRQNKYLQNGHPIVYWKQTMSGTWEKVLPQ